MASLLQFEGRTQSGDPCSDNDYMKLLGRSQTNLTQIIQDRPGCLHGGACARTSSSRRVISVNSSIGFTCAASPACFAAPYLI